MRIKSIAVSATLAAGLLFAADASATTLATFDIGGVFEYDPATADGSEFTVSGSFAGDATSIGDPSLVQPLIFSGTLSGSLTDPFSIGPVVLLDGATDPIETSIEDVALFALFAAAEIADTLSVATGGISDDVFSYVLENSGDPFEFVPGYTLTTFVSTSIMGLTIGGDYSIAVSSSDGAASLDSVVSDFLGLPPAASGFLAGGFAGDFDGSLAISTPPAVPLPASLPLFAVGGLALFGVSRRRKRLN